MAEEVRARARARSERTFPGAPAVTEVRLAPRVDAAVSRLVAAASGGTLDRHALAVIADSRDARLGWLVSDLLRFTSDARAEDDLVATFETLTGTRVRGHPSFRDSSWRTITDHLIAWDLPAPQRYRELKGRLFVAVEPGWTSFFANADAEIDYRLVSWGGVLIDDRREGDPERVRRMHSGPGRSRSTSAAAGDWYADERTVFGVVVGDEALALPKHQMEVHELVNVTIGGRRLGVPYCTLCGSAQAYLLDAVPVGVSPPVLRTSGLLSRSNKVMYDLRSRSLIDTFTGRALSGPLESAGVVLEQATVVTSTWGAWKRAHPETMILAEDGGIGREYDDDPLAGRDDAGPIFPIGDVDPRLPIQAPVLGVVAPGGRPVAFGVDQARAALRDRKSVAAAGVEVIADGDGLRARSRAGRELPAHQAFWFAWSQFHPDTALWTPLG